MQTKPFSPFSNERDELEIGRLVIENRIDRVSLHGDIDLTMDREGLAHARLLQKILSDVIAQLESKDLPEHLPAPAKVTVRNPFK